MSDNQTSNVGIQNKFDCNFQPCYLCEIVCDNESQLADCVRPLNIISEQTTAGLHL